VLRAALLALCVAFGPEVAAACEEHEAAPQVGVEAPADEAPEDDCGCEGPCLPGCGRCACSPTSRLVVERAVPELQPADPAASIGKDCVGAPRAAHREPPFRPPSA